MSLKNTSTYLPASAVRIDLSGTILAVNDEWHWLVKRGLVPEELAYGVGLNFLDACDKVTGPFSKYAQRAGQGIREVIRGERSQFAMEYHSQAPAIAQRVLLQVVPLVEESGQLLLLHTPIVSPNRDIEKTLQQQKLASLGMLTTSLIHDANNLLQLLSLQLAIIRRKIGINASVMANVSSATQTLDQLTLLAQQLRQYSAPGKRVPKILDINQLIEDNRVIMQMSLGGGSVEFTVKSQSDLPAIFADRTDVLRIILNLIMDAVEEGKERTVGRVVVSTTHFDNKKANNIKDIYTQCALPAGSYIILKIANCDDDTKVPIIGSSLEPFYLSQIEEQCLGITMITPLVHELNGAIRIGGDIDKGAQFYVYLPVHSA